MAAMHCTLAPHVECRRALLLHGCCFSASVKIVVIISHMSIQVCDMVPIKRACWKGGRFTCVSSTFFVCSHLQTGEAMINDPDRLKDPVEFVQTLLGERDKFERIIVQAFSDDKLFRNSLNQVRQGDTLH